MRDDLENIIVELLEEARFQALKGMVFSQHERINTLVERIKILENQNKELNNKVELLRKNARHDGWVV